MVFDPKDPKAVAFGPVTEFFLVRDLSLVAFEVPATLHPLPGSLPIWPITSITDVLPLTVLISVTASSPLKPIFVVISA